MQRNDDSHLKPAFAELHRRHREQAPPFGAMRERARRAADGPPRRTVRAAWSLATATACIAAALAWWAMRSPAPREPATLASVERAEQLLDAIEHDAAIFSPLYPTDLLLTHYDTQQSQ